MALTIQIHRHGGPEVIEVTDAPVSAPQAGEVSLRHSAIGLNFIDIYHRSGLYPLALPSGLGLEAAGVVTAVGPGVDFVKAGDRVAYAYGPIGAYCEARTMPAAQLVKLPTDITDETAAALLLKGMTAAFLLTQTYPVAAGTVLLVHAAGGGVGSVMVPWAKQLGATVIGTAGGKEKCALAKGYGCDQVIDYRAQDFVAAVRKLTDGRGVDVVYDAVGKDTFMGSLDCLKRRGMLVSFGNASGAPEPLAPGVLAAKGSLYLTRASLFDYISTRDELDALASALFEMIRQGVIKADVRQRFPLADAARAHRELESRRTSGASILVPDSPG